MRIRKRPAKVEMSGAKAQTGPAPDRDNECTICQVKVSPEDKALTHESHCDSSFHAQCLKDRDSKCPLCRGIIRTRLTKDAEYQQFLAYFDQRESTRAMMQVDKADDDFRLRDAAVMVNEREAIREMSRMTRETDRELRVEGFRREMRGESFEEVEAQHRDSRHVTQKDHLEAEANVAEWAEQQQMKLMKN